MSVKQSEGVKHLFQNRAQQVLTTGLTEADAKAYVDGLFGLGGSAGSSDTNTVAAAVESTYVMQRGCDVSLPVDSGSGKNRAEKSDISNDISTTLEAAAQMARTVRGSTQPGVRQIALLKHYRLVGTNWWV